MAIARNLSQGDGFTVDGRHATNGFQPLWVCILALVYWIARVFSVAPERLVLFTHWLIYLGTALALASTLSRAVKVRSPTAELKPLLFWMVVFLYLAAPLTFMHSFNGLETGLYLLTLVIAVRAFQSIDIYSLSGATLQGVLLGVCILARIDAVLLVAAVFLGLILLSSFAVLRRRLVLATTFGISTFVVSSPWWIYNTVAFGSPMPISGSSQSAIALSADRFAESVKASLAVAFPWAYHNRLANDGLYVLFALVALGSIGLLVRQWRYYGYQFSLSLRIRGAHSRLFVVSVVGFLLLLFGYYSVTSVAIWFYYRYFSPAILVSTSLIAIVLTAEVSGKYTPGQRKPRWILLPGPVLLLLGLLSAQMLYYGSFMKRQRYSSWYLQDQVGLVDRYVPKEDCVAAWQTGTLGYILPNVVNLDGKVNADALRHRHLDNLYGYIVAEDIRWFCDISTHVVDCLGEHPRQNGWVLHGKSGAFELWHR